MEKKKDKTKKLIPYICTIVIIIAMVLMADILDNKEIIFPEIAALAVGYMVAPKRSWKVNGKRMVILITGCAIMGVLIVRYAGLGRDLEVPIAFSIAQVIFMFSGTTFAPFVSAIVLPVMMRTTSIIYPIAAFLLTLLIVLFHNLFLKTGIRNDEEYVPVMLNSVDDIIDTVLRILCVSIVSYISFQVGLNFIVAPPLLVAFTEFSRPRNKTRNKPFRTISVITVCALMGSLCRWLICVKLSFPLVVGTSVAICFMLFIIHYTKMYMPPVGAIVMLSMIIPEETLMSYPIQIFIGSTVIIFLSRLLFMKRQDKKKYDMEHELKAER
ncbi:MAG: hypothetical protein J6O17_06080 [Eubacterium sp.]|nr:hypothetical protein [Eubacterium sp.]